LIEKQRHSIVLVGLVGNWDRPHGHLGSAPSDDLVAMDGYETIEHIGFLNRASGSAALEGHM
jgi:hypothetical protein